MKKRWSNAALFVSLTHGWPEYDYPAYAAVEFALACASAAPPAACFPRAHRLCLVALMMDFGKMRQCCASGQFADSGRRWRHPAFVRNGTLEAFSPPGCTSKPHPDRHRPVLRAIGPAPLDLKRVTTGHPPSLKILWPTSAMDANVMSAMKVDLKGRINNITLPISKPLLPVFEAIINGMHAVEDAREPNGKVVIKIQRDKRQSELNVDVKKSSQPILNFVITDNGIGFTAAHYDSFQTSDSTLKMDRGAKGIGRFFWLKAFEQVLVSSRFVDDGKTFERSFRFSISGNGVEGGEAVESTVGEAGTSVSLLEFAKQYEKVCPKKAHTITEKILEHCLSYFLDPKCPNIQLVDDDEDTPLDLNKIFAETIMPNVKRGHFKINGHTFEITHLKIFSGDPLQHTVHFCANNRDVQSEALHSKIPHLKQKIIDRDGKAFVYMAYVSSAYLDQRVNAERTTFNLPKEGELVPKGEITEAALMTETVDQIKAELAVFLDAIMDAAKSRIAELIEKKYPEYRPLLDRIVMYIDEIPVVDDEEALVFKLNEIQLREDLKAREEGEKLVAQAASVPADDPDYDNRVKEYLGHVTENSRSRLAQYVIHRKVILELLKGRLEVGDTGKYRKEEEIHKVIFPMKATSNQVAWEGQNLWIIDERLVYHYFLSSDKPLKEVEALDNASTKRPDLLVLNRPGGVYGLGHVPLGIGSHRRIQAPGKKGLRSKPHRANLRLYQGHFGGRRKRPKGAISHCEPEHAFLRLRHLRHDKEDEKFCRERVVQKDTGRTWLFRV